MTASADKQPDQTRIVSFLAEESHRPVADVALLYERERAELASIAHITKFLHIFAIRNVQGILHQQALVESGAQPAASPVLGT